MIGNGRQQGFEAARLKMRQAGVSASAIEVFSHYYTLLESGETGLIRENTITPLLDVPMLDTVEVSEEQEKEAIGATVIIKLNGGLGALMRQDKAKNLLEVRDGLNFFDLIVRQVCATRHPCPHRMLSGPDPRMVPACPR